jgi:hypothetical protein
MSSRSEHSRAIGYTEMDLIILISQHEVVLLGEKQKEAQFIIERMLASYRAGLSPQYIQNSTLNLMNFNHTTFEILMRFLNKS